MRDVWLAFHSEHDGRTPPQYRPTNIYNTENWRQYRYASPSRENHEKVKPFMCLSKTI
jgi:hypothetical protein